MENKHKLKIVKKNEEIKQFFIDDKEINLNGLEKILIDVAYTRGSYPTEKITVTFIDFESLEIINEEITPSKTSELMMKVSVSVELKEISTEDLQNELLSRQREIYDIEKEILVLWANGKGLQEFPTSGRTKKPACRNVKRRRAADACNGTRPDVQAEDHSDG